MHNEKDPNSLIDNRVRAIFEDSRGTFWVGTAGDGLHTMDRAKGVFDRHPYDPLHPDRLSRPPLRKTIPYGFDHITFITEDNKHRIWIGTFEGGINIYNPATQKISHYESDSGSNEKLKDNHFWSVFKTKDDILWVSTWENNLYKINPHTIKLPFKRTGGQVFDFAEDDAHDLWMGTDKALVHENPNGQQEQFFIGKKSPVPNTVFKIEKYDNKFWTFTAQGLFLFDPAAKTFTNYHPHQEGNVNSLSSDTVISIKKTDDNQLCFGTFKGLDLMDIKTGVFRHFQNNQKDTESISDNQIFTVYISNDQQIWVGTNNGLNLLNRQTGKFKRYLDQSFIYSIMEDKAGVLWAGTSRGLYEYDRKTGQFFIFYGCRIGCATYNCWHDGRSCAKSLAFHGKGHYKIEQRQNRRYIIW